MIAPPPPARRAPVRDTLHGVTVEDPYRWLEDWKGREARAWVAAQGAYARASLDALPEREALLARISALSGGDPVLANLQMSAGRAFYLLRGPDDNVARLIVRTTPDALERVLLDPNTVGGEVHTTIDWYVPSRDGRLVAYGLSQGGSEESVLHALEVDSGAVLDLAITRCRFGGVSWLPDNRSFVYHRLAEQPAGAPETELYADSATHLHRLGDDPEGDPVVFGRDLAPGVDIARADFPIVEITPGGDRMIGVIQHGVQNELTLYTAPLSGLDDPAVCPWRRIAGVDDGVVGYAAGVDVVYLRTHAGASRYKIVATSLEEPDLARAVTVVPQSGAVIEDMRVAGGYLLTRDLDGGIGGMRRVRRTGAGGARLEAAPAPVDGTIMGWAGESSSPETLVQLTSWTVSPRVYRYHADDNTLEDTGWLASSPVDFGDIEAHEVFAPAPDGVMIPLSIIHKRGLALDGRNPTLMAGYGSYGLIPYPPTFMPTMLAWYERGGVYAVAHIRGGGEYGREWHEAGRKLTKETTISDFIACADYLVEQGYTSPRYLAGEGTSAGGIPSGGSLVRRPDLWAAMVIRVAMLNALRFEQSENGPPNVPEFGSVATEEGFGGLRIMDSYMRVVDGVAYPAVLLTTGLNDPRVVVWQASKMVARLQAATSSGKPVLLRVEEHGGHGAIAASRRQNDEELADKLAFLLSVMG